MASSDLSIAFEAIKAIVGIISFCWTWRRQTISTSCLCCDVVLMKKLK